MPLLQFDCKKGGVKTDVVQSTGSAITGAVRVVADTSATKKQVLLALSVIMQAVVQLPWPNTSVTPPVLPTFALQSETTAIATAFTASGQSASAARQYTIDKGIRYLKGGADAGDVWAKLTGLWIVGDTSGQTLINWRNPGTNNLAVVGAPVFTAPSVALLAKPDNTKIGYQASATSMALNTGITLSQLYAAGTFSFGCYTGSSSVVGVDFGAKDSTGAALIYAGNTSSTPSAQACSSGGNFGSAGVTDGQYLTSCVRSNSTTTSVYHNGVLVETKTADAITAPTTGTSPMRFLTSSSPTSYSAKPFQGGFIALTALTAAEVDLVYRVMRTWIESIESGDVLINEAGYAPQAPSHQAIVYGWTLQSVTHALELARQGKDVALVGGWRDRTINQMGGVSANGLNRTDITSYASIGGLARYLFYRCNVYDGITDTGSGSQSGTGNTQARTVNLMCRQSLDKARMGFSGNITVYCTNGVKSVTKSGLRITSITTMDGRTFTAPYFADGSYESDLAGNTPGVTTIIGREAAGTGTEALNGFRGAALTTRPLKSSVYYDINPFVNGTDSSAGYIYGVNPAVIGSTVGAADGQVQAYNFRLTVQSTAGGKNGVPWPTTPPPGYAASNYEFQMRYAAQVVAGGGSYTLDDAFLRDACPNSSWDFNNSGPAGDDFLNRANDYTGAADYSAREPVVQQLKNWIMGYCYMVAREADSRIASTAARTSMLANYLPADTYLEPHPNDLPYWPSVPYIREHRRLVSDFVMNGNDMTATAGSASRSTETLACANYAIDSHNNQRFAYNNAGTWTTLAEGTLSASIGGTNSMIPLPRGICVPKATECENLCVLFGFSATHVANSAIRMEAPSMALSQGMGIAVAIALENGNQSLQAVDYNAIRARLKASASFTGEVSPTDAQLPQTN